MSDFPQWHRAFPGSVTRLLGPLLLATSSCVGFQPANVPLERHDPDHGYRGDQVERGNKIIIYLAFSGGGTRAAAFAYGVLEELHDTKITVDEQEKTLLDEVDTISGVSGGSFPAAYYGLFGDRIFEDFAERFLRKNVQAALFLRILRPWNLIRLATPWLSRSAIASRYYDEKVFDGATYADLQVANGPRIHINATDLSSGNRVTFNQNGFDVICSDVNQLHVSTAVAASSAVPILLSPITFQNFAGSCGYEPPAQIADAVANRRGNRRLDRAAQNFLEVQDVERKPYIHLIDGGISDNLGLRPTIDFLTLVLGTIEAADPIAEVIPEHLVVIVVNAETDPNPAIDLASAAPSFASLMNSVSGSQIRRNNFETLLLMEDMLRAVERELADRGHSVDSHMINVSFDEFDDGEERLYFKLMPTSFVLTGSQVDRLRNARRELLRRSEAFQRLLRELE